MLDSLGVLHLWSRCSTLCFDSSDHAVIMPELQLWVMHCEDSSIYPRFLSVICYCHNMILEKTVEVKYRK